MRLTVQRATCFFLLAISIGPLAAQRYFEFIVPVCADSTDIRFIAKTSDSTVLELVDSQLSIPFNQRQLFIIGPVDSGDGGHNQGWNWHFKPDLWTLTFNAIEVCDGCPQYVEENPDYWIKTLGIFCPWGARVERELTWTNLPSDAEIQSSFYLHIYPNPFNSESSIYFELLKNTHVTLEVFDILGKKLDTIKDGYLSIGFHHFNWDGSRFAAGIYFLVLRGYGYTLIRKMVLIR